MIAVILNVGVPERTYTSEREYKRANRYCKRQCYRHVNGVWFAVFQTIKGGAKFKWLQAIKRVFCFVLFLCVFLFVFNTD